MIKLEPKHMWMSLPVILLMMSVSIGLTGYFLASKGIDAEVERDYYSRALNWDQHQALVAASLDLGWHVEVTPGYLSSNEPLASQIIEVSLTLVDREGKAVEGASGSIEAFQVAHGDHTVDSILIESAPGVYRANFQPKYRGSWVWILRFDRGDEVFVGEVRKDVSFAPKTSQVKGI